MDPVTSPTELLEQTVFGCGRASFLSVCTEAGCAQQVLFGGDCTFPCAGGGGCFHATVPLLPNHTNHITVCTPCRFGAPCVTTDGNGDPLEIVQMLPTPATPLTEFRVNTYTASDQEDATVAADASGNFIVVWESRGQDGDLGGVFGQRYDSLGTPSGSEFQVNTYTSEYQYLPAIAGDAQGNFIVVWRDRGQSQIAAQRYDSSGARLGTEFRVAGDGALPAVASNAAGKAVLAWLGADGNEGGILARRYDSSGAALGTEFQVNSYTTGYQGRPAVAVGTNGDFLITWHSFAEDGDGFGVFARRYDSTGASSSGAFQVNTYTAGFEYEPAVAAQPGGGFVVVWNDPDRGVLAQRYDDSALPTGTEFLVTGATLNSFPAVVADTTGSFTVAWETHPSAGADVLARRYDSTGSPLGDPFQVNEFTPRSQGNPAIAALGSGGFVVVWQSDAYGDQDVLARRLPTPGE